MDLSKPIPISLRVESASRHLYIRGLSYIQNGPKKRHFIYKPKVIFGVFFTYLIRNVVLISTSGDVNRRLVTVLADFGYYLNIQFVVNVASAVCCMLGMATMIIYWINYKRRIVPTFLRVFDMICGQISPKDIGLTSEEQVLSLIRRTGLMFKAMRLLVDRIAFVVIILACGVPAFHNSSTVESIIYVLPNTIWTYFFGHYSYCFFLYKMSYLYIMCSYLKMKIGSVGEEMKQSIKQRRRPILAIIKKFSDIFEEINEYNTTYWSKYLFVFWLTLGTIGIACLSIVVKGSVNTMLTIIWSFITFYWLAAFLVVILTTASVNSSINRTYCKWNSLFIHFRNECKAKQNVRFTIKTLIKVIHVQDSSFLSF